MVVLSEQSKFQLDQPPFIDQAMASWKFHWHDKRLKTLIWNLIPVSIWWWSLWKDRNRRALENKERNLPYLIDHIKYQAYHWATCKIPMWYTNGKTFSFCGLSFLVVEEVLRGQTLSLVMLSLVQSSCYAKVLYCFSVFWVVGSLHYWFLFFCTFLMWSLIYSHFLIKFFFSCFVHFFTE